jgi:hypothetical protein
MPQQHQRMSARHPQFRLVVLRPNLAEWQGGVQPSPLGDTYTVRVRYEKYKSPLILVVSPELRLHEDAASIPHTYVGNKLCLHYPDYEEWSSDKYVAETIVPWVSLWLLYYEGWLATGKWLGGGIEHGVRDKRQK